MTRKIIQLATMPAVLAASPFGRPPRPEALYALCDDGSVWVISDYTMQQWGRVAAIPEDAT